MMASPLALRLRSGRAQAAVAEGKGPPDEALDPNDPISVLYGRRLTFENGLPYVTVRVFEGAGPFTFVPHGRLRATTRGPVAATTQGPAGERWTVRVVQARPGKSVARVLVGEHLFSDPKGAQADQKFFRDHGYRTLLLSVGTVYGIAGRAVDTRRLLVLLEADGTPESAQALAEELDGKFGLRPEVYREPIERGHGRLELLSPRGDVVAQSEDALTLETEGDRGVTIEHVGWGMGFPRHGVEDRTYKGRLYAAVDAKGLLVAVNFIGLENLAKGIVPSEIFAASPPEALKAQAVTARGEILAKVGARHIGDPYLLCSEQHCQVFRGASGEDPRASRAVEATRGEALFAPNGGPLVPSYYSAICGGYTEDNEVVWGGVPNPSLRGRPDFDLDDSTRRFADGIGEALVRPWVETEVPAFCRPRRGADASRFRWRRTFTQAEVDAIARPYGVGIVGALEVEGRGISGRARSLLLKGDQGQARIHSELAIRRAFGMLNSGAFVVDVEGSGRARHYLFRGAGWGHGAGMCQEGAIGRAERGASHREILTHYFSGAEVVRMYG